MSENIVKDDQAISIQINNSDSNSGGGSGSFLDRIFDIGLKLIVPLGLIYVLIAVVILVQVVLPLINFVSEFDFPLLDAFQFTPLGSLVAGVGALAGWIIGR